MLEHRSILTTHLVVVNNEDQHSVWPADRDLPPGWRAEGASGTEEQCLDHIERTWTDLYPLSARQGRADRREEGPAC